MFVVDTNILIYAVDKNSQEHSRCRELIQDWRKDFVPWYLTWSIIYEFLRVSTHPKVFSRPINIEQAWEFIRALLTSPGLKILSQGPNHSQIAQQTFNEIKGLKGNLIHDSHTAILMREHGITKIYTRNTDYHRFPFLEVIDPLN